MRLLVKKELMLRHCIHMKFIEKNSQNKKIHFFKEWLAPLPDRSLPNIKIREFMIDTLRDVS